MLLFTSHYISEANMTVMVTGYSAEKDSFWINI